jgi:ribosomal protein S18 acetylase RimI-like enzyme
MFDLETDPSDEDVATIAAGLLAFNQQNMGPANLGTLAIFHRVAGEVRAGLIGEFAWNSLHIEKIWVAGELRGQGIASQLLAEAEAEAVRRSCRFAWLDTMNEHAAQLYSRRGYEPYGNIPNFYKGKNRQFLLKPLE